MHKEDICICLTFIREPHPADDQYDYVLGLRLRAFYNKKGDGLTPSKFLRSQSGEVLASLMKCNSLGSRPVGARIKVTLKYVRL